MWISLEGSYQLEVQLQSNALLRVRETTHNLHHLDQQETLGNFDVNNSLHGQRPSVSCLCNLPSNVSKTVWKHSMMAFYLLTSKTALYK